MTEHPITPRLDLLRKWGDVTPWTDALVQAARWGADCELESCCGWLEQNCGRWELPAALRAARRPKPPSLKQQALKAFSAVELMAENYKQFGQDVDTIRRALEALPDD